MHLYRAISGWLLALLLAFPYATGQAATPVRESRYDAAIEFYKNKLKQDPYDFFSAIFLGETYTSRARLTGSVADYRKAEAAFRKSLALMPKNNLEAKVGLAGALASQHRFKEADAIVKEALLESPETPALWALAGDIAFDLGDYDHAGGFYKLFSKTKPGLESWSRLAKIEMLNGQWQTAQKLWEQVCTLPEGSNPEPSAWAWVMRGELFLTMGKMTDALNCYEHALTLMPDFALALEHKAEIKLMEKKFDEAISLYLHAITSSNNPELFILLADAYEKAGRHNGAVTAWKSGEKAYNRLMKTGNVGYLRPLALFYLNHKKHPEKALTLAQEDLAIRQDFGVYLTLARAYLQLGKNKEALSAIQKPCPLAENDPQFCYYSGEIYLANGNMAEARRLFTQASHLCPIFDQIFNTDLTGKLIRLENKISSN